ncbi:MAG: DUF4364 family protein [Oscillospiraceae bacterium]
METPRIRIENIDEIRVLVCHLIYSLGCPLTKNQLIEITSLEEAVNYFNLIEALDGIGDRLCIVEEADGETVYSNTKLGVKAARELGDTLPASVKEKMFDEAVKVYTRDAMKKKGALLAVRYVNNANGSCTVGITVKDEETGRQKYYLSIAAENSERAELIKNKVSKDPKAFSKYLDDYFA